MNILAFGVNLLPSPQGEGRHVNTVDPDDRRFRVRRHDPGLDRPAANPIIPPTGIGTSEDAAVSTKRVWCLWGLLAVVIHAGCASPYRADRGALFGGAMGAGLGAVAGAAVGDPLAGAAIGGVAGTMTGAVVGGAIDEVEARNRAEIAARLGRPAPLGAVTVPDVVSMTQAGVAEDVIATHVRNHGVAQPLSPNDLIYLQQNGVAPRVVQAMQSSSGPAAYPASPPYIVEAAPPPVVVVDPYCPGPYYPPPPRWSRHHHHHHHGPRLSWGVSVSSDDF